MMRHVSVEPYPAYISYSLDLIVGTPRCGWKQGERVSHFLSYSSDMLEEAQAVCDEHNARPEYQERGDQLEVHATAHSAGFRYHQTVEGETPIRRPRAWGP